MVASAHLQRFEYEARGVKFNIWLMGKLEEDMTTFMVKREEIFSMGRIA